tara:strand:+ start:1014 stop:1871 length:858 start_codon:yes stop_codon:yes gene_type:complete
LKNKNDIPSKFDLLKEKHKLSFTDDSTYNEKWSFQLSALNLISLAVFYSTLIIVIIFLLIRFTPLRSLFVDNTNLYELNQNLSENSIFIDSLEKKIGATDIYLKDLRKILKGEKMDDDLSDSSNFISGNYMPDFSKNAADSILRSKIEKETIGEISFSNNDKEIGFFMNPVHGLISKSFNRSNKHFGVDVVTQKDEPIKSTLEGIVIFSNWTSSEGNVIIIQHHNNIISAYKHCSILLEDLGSRVDVGDPIAIVGNSGEFTDGPHLHFEIWQNGVALNPQEFISF